MHINGRAAENGNRQPQQLIAISGNNFSVHNYALLLNELLRFYSSVFVIAFRSGWKQVKDEKIPLEKKERERKTK